MKQITEMENIVNEDGMCVVHLMSNSELTMDSLKKYNAAPDAKVDITQEDGVHHLRATWLIRGAMKVVAEGWPRPKIFVLWSLTGCASVRTALREAAKHYQDIFGKRPEYAFTQKLPGDVENGVEVDDLMLFEAKWMSRKCVAVGWLYE